jgi:predicted RNase H-like nuclease (RuvC/YqgF family)
MQKLRHTLVINKEKLHNLKTDVTVAIDDICMEPRNYMHIKVPVSILDHIEYTVMCTFEELEKLQQIDQSNHEEHEQKFQLENKEEEIKRLKTKVINLTEEMEELKTHDNKRK